MALTRNDARLIAEELYKLMGKKLVAGVKEAATEVAQAEADRQLSVKEAAKLLGIAPGTVYNCIDAIPHYRVGRRLRFSSLALEAYLRDRPTLRSMA